MTASRSRLLVIVGPTASGKSAVAEALQDRIDSEIVSADSMQVYRGMDIATDKPDAVRRSRHRYHLINVADPGEAFTVVRYRDLARAAVSAIGAASRLPILVGGSGLYVRAVMDDLEFPPPLDTLPDETRAALERRPTADLYAELRRRDSAAAARIHPHNRRRIVRALEFIIQTARPFSELQERFTTRRAVYDVRLFGLARGRRSLYDAIHRRVDAMIDSGLAEEARRFREQPVMSGASRQALGYKELAGYLAGTESLEDAIARLKRSTRRFAKRQMTWFSADERVEWIDADRADAVELAQLVIGRLTSEGWLDRSLLRTARGD